MAKGKSPNTNKPRFDEIRWDDLKDACAGGSETLVMCDLIDRAQEALTQVDPLILPPETANDLSDMLRTGETVKIMQKFGEPDPANTIMQVSTDAGAGPASGAVAFVLTTRVVLILPLGVHTAYFYNPVEHYVIIPHQHEPKGGPMEDRLRYCASIWSILIAGLAIMQVPQVIEYTQREARRVPRGKGRTVMSPAHTVVHLHPGAKRFMTDPSGRPKRSDGSKWTVIEHEVRGHWAHYRIQPGCAHIWEDVPKVEGDPHRRQKCKNCTARRTWRDGFVKGDPDKKRPPRPKVLHPLTRDTTSS